MTPAISIVVPALNEAALIQTFLKHLRVRAPGAEVIVIDGGSSDGTADLACGFCDRVFVSHSGRVAQMNAGAQLARGDVLWFLHVDSEVPEGCSTDIVRLLEDRRIVGGYFRVRLPRRGWIYRVQDTLGHPVGVLLRVRCGDHGIFCRRAAFVDAGGYPKVPLMEDVGLIRQLYRRGRVVSLRAEIITSLRRQDQVGPYRYTAGCVTIVALYCFGIPETFLAWLYKRMVPAPPLPARVTIESRELA